MPTWVASFYDSSRNDRLKHLYDAGGAGPHLQLCDSGPNDPAPAEAGDTLKYSLYGNRRRCLPFALHPPTP